MALGSFKHFKVVPDLFFSYAPRHCVERVPRSFVGQSVAYLIRAKCRETGSRCSGVRLRRALLLAEAESLRQQRARGHFATRLNASTHREAATTTETYKHASGLERARVCAVPARTHRSRPDERKSSSARLAGPQDDAAAPRHHRHAGDADARAN